MRGASLNLLSCIQAKTRHGEKGDRSIGSYAESHAFADGVLPADHLLPGRSRNSIAYRLACAIDVQACAAYTVKAFEHIVLFARPSSASRPDIRLTDQVNQLKVPSQMSVDLEASEKTWNLALGYRTNVSRQCNI